MSVWRTAQEASMSGETDVYLFKDVLYAGGREEPILAMSPGLQTIADILPSLNIKDITDEMISEFADMLDEARDPVVRYAIMSFLDRLELTPKWRALLRKTLKRLSKPMPRSADEALARLLLIHFALEDKDHGQIQAYLAQGLPHKPFPPTPERNLYVESVWAMNQAANYFTRYGDYPQAKQAHGKLMERFPKTKVSKKAEEAITEIDTDPVSASLKAIDHHARIEKQMKPKFNKDALYDDVINNAGFEPLRQAVREKKEKEQKNN